MMMLRPYRFETAVTVVAGVPSRLVDTSGTSWGTKTLTGQHTSGTGNVMIFITTRSNTAGVLTITGVTWDGNALTEISSGSLTGLGRAVGWCGYITGSSTGAHDIVVTASGAAARKLIGYAVDLSAAISLGDAPAAVVTNVVQSSESITITPTDPNSLLLGYVCALDENVADLGVNVDWTEVDEHKTGTGGTADFAAIIGSRTSGGVAALAFTGTSEALGSTDDWCAMGFELLPV